MLEAYLDDPDVIDLMASHPPPKPGKPSLFGWTATVSALKDIQDQLIASRGGTQFVPRPEIKGHTERWRRVDSKLKNTVELICGSE